MLFEIITNLLKQKQFLTQFARKNLHLALTWTNFRIKGTKTVTLTATPKNNLFVRNGNLSARASCISEYISLLHMHTEKQQRKITIFKLRF